MQCPKCAHPMETVSVQGLEIQRCEGCSGLWFDDLEHEELQAIVGADEEIDTGNASTGRKMNQDRDINCPNGHGPMISIRIAEQPHIRYEQCTVCDGAFMDAGEFSDFSHETFTDFIRDFFVDDDSG